MRFVVTSPFGSMYITSEGRFSDGESKREREREREREGVSHCTSNCVCHNLSVSP